MIEIGNTFALLALLGWPIVVVLLFKKFSPERAVIWSILGAYMFLPQLSAINFPGLPPMNKETIPNLSAFMVCLGLWGRIPQILPKSFLAKVLLILFIVSPVITVLTNLEPIQFGVDQFGGLTMIDGNALQVAGLPGLRIYDSLSVLVQQFLAMLVFFLAREVLRTEEAIREILIALVFAGLIYAGPMVWEARFSPQLHTQLYGFFQHDFVQAIRATGFRPFVFMPHGLWVAFFAFMCAMAAAVFARKAQPGSAGRNMLILVVMVGLVFVCKSMGALSFTFAFVPLVLLLRPRAHLAIAALLVTLVMAYPMLRGSGIIPTDRFVEEIAQVNETRASSLEYRFNNEDTILDHVSNKPLFGWGGWGRFLVYNPQTGESDTVVDGQWIIIIGNYGWLGYIAMFGLLTLPVLSLWWRARKPDAPPVPLEVSVLALILAVNMVDLLPNATLIPFTWLMAGSLLGYVEELRAATRAAQIEKIRRTHSGVVLGFDLSAPDENPRGPVRRSVL